MELDFVNAANQIARASTATPLPVEVVSGGSTPTTQVLAFEATANGTGYTTGNVLTATVTLATGAVVWKNGTTVISTPTTGTYKPLGAVTGGTTVTYTGNYSSIAQSTVNQPVFASQACAGARITVLADVNIKLSAWATPKICKTGMVLTFGAAELTNLNQILLGAGTATADALQASIG